MGNVSDFLRYWQATPDPCIVSQNLPSDRKEYTSIMTVPRAVHDGVFLWVGPVSPQALRPVSFACLRLVIILTLVSVAMPAPVAAADFDPTENPWGFGYDGGLTLRRKLGDKWEVGISGGPNDYLSSRTDEENRESFPSSSTSSAQYDSDGRQEGGFVASHFGRSVWQHGAFDMICYLQGKFLWSNRRDTDERSQDEPNGTSGNWSSRDDDLRNWSLAVVWLPDFMIHLNI
jgi:hypothetical protein